MKQRHYNSKLVAVAAHTRNLKIKKRDAQKQKSVNVLRRVSIRIPYAHKEWKERKIILGEQKKIMNKYVLPHFAEFQNFNQDFDEATLTEKRADERPS